MKMKKIIGLFSLVLLTLLSSCSDILEETPEFTLNGQTIFRSQATAQLSLNACYGYLAGQQMYGQFTIAATEIASGLHRSKYNEGDALSRFARLVYTPDDNYNGFFWSGAYKTIAECNAFIENIDVSSLESKDHMAAQAKFIRGLAYYNLVHIYGGVPLRIGASTADNIHLERAPKEAVISQIVSDFTDASIALKDIEGDTSVPSKVSAFAMLAKVYFLQASAEGAGSSLWGKAKDAGTQVFNIAGGDLPLEPNFSTLFEGNTKESVESIFKLNYAVENSGSFNKNSWMYSPAASTTTGINFGARGVSKGFFNFFRSEHPNDPRIDASFSHTSYINKNGGVIKIYPDPARLTATHKMAHAFFKKHFDPSQIGQSGAKTFFVYRYADFLLLMADVENELGNSGIALSYVNKVLTRARNSVSPSATEPADLNGTLSQEEIRQAIFNERLFELNQEGHSFMDIRRRGYDYFNSFLERHNADPDASATFSSTHPWSSKPMPETRVDVEKAFLMPIPTIELNTNDKIKLEDQNPGY